MIKSAYNFVPLSDKVFLPDWGNKISHDIPFEDGESGSLAIKIKAESPLYVRNGSNNINDNNFSNVNGKHFIPGTSLKGMVRSVLEIMTFGKMQFVDDRRFTWRDLTKQGEAYRTQFTKSQSESPLVKVGFIIKKDSEWKLIPAKFARIEQCDLNQNIGTSDNMLSGKDKYKYWTEFLGMPLIDKFKVSELSNNVFIKQSGTFYRAIHASNTQVIEQITEREDIPVQFNRTVKGQLVFTGQIKKRDRGSEGNHGGPPTGRNKHLEFVFFDKETNEKNYLKIPEKMKKDFQLNHTSDRNQERHSNSLAPNDEWGYWKEKVENGGEMPVFWLEKKGEVGSFGMSMLYRLPLENSIHDQIKKTTSTHVNHIKDNKFVEEKFIPDLADCMFGYTVAKKALKGRIQFTHAFINDATCKTLREKSEVLASPKATFYPNYLQSGNYSSKNNIAGWKRYPIHRSITSPINETGNRNIETQFIPLDEGAEFEFKINFHNLKKVEIGALLSALTFHDTEECFHSIGMAKPLGYGKISLHIEQSDLKYDIKEYLKELEVKLNLVCFEQDPFREHNKNRWAESVKELITMASEQDNQGNSELSYMELKGFVEAKKRGERLNSYSSLHNITERKVNAILSDDDVKELFIELKKDEEEAKLQEEKAKEEEAKAEVARIEAEKEKLKAEEQERKKQQQIELKAQGLDKIEDETDITKISSTVNSYVKVCGELSPELKEELAVILEKSFKETGEKEKKWNKKKKHQPIRKIFVQAFGEEELNQLYKKIGKIK